MGVLMGEKCIFGFKKLNFKPKLDFFRGFLGQKADFGVLR